MHGDFTLGNVLLDDDHRISGIVDFGDCGYTAQVADFAVACRIAPTRPPRAATSSESAGSRVDGYASRVPFEREELAVLGDLVAARLAMIVAISAWRVRRYPENAAIHPGRGRRLVDAARSCSTSFGPDAVARGSWARSPRRQRRTSWRTGGPSRSAHC